MDYFKCLKTIALNNVLNPNGDYRLREIFRWYSKTFHTPLHLVSNLPLEDILMAYFEEMYAKLDEDDVKEQKQLLLETEEQRVERIMTEESEKIGEYRFLQQAKEAEKLKINKKNKNNLIKNPTKDKAPILPEEEVKIVFTDDNLDIDQDSVPVNKKSDW